LYENSKVAFIHVCLVENEKLPTSLSGRQSPWLVCELRTVSVTESFENWICCMCY
jgi:hypothetical protein